VYASNCTSQNYHLTVIRAYNSRGYVTLSQEFENVKVDSANQRSMKAIAGAARSLILKFQIPIAKFHSSWNETLYSYCCAFSILLFHSTRITNCSIYLFIVLFISVEIKQKKNDSANISTVNFVKLLIL